MGHKFLDFDHQFLHAPERAPTNSFLGDDVEPDFNLVQPGGVRRRVMNMIAGAGRPPASHPFMLMGGVVIHH